MLHYSMKHSFIQGVPQLVPEAWCLQCKICCRFPDTQGVQTPTWSAQEADWAIRARGDPTWFQKEESSPSLHPRLESCGSDYRCPAFQNETNQCSIYSVRPLDCRLYPFVLTKNSADTKVMLAMDAKCPYIEAHGSDPATLDYIAKLLDYLERPAALEYLKSNPKIISPSWPEFISVGPLPAMIPTVWHNVPPPHPALRPFTFEQLPFLREALGARPHASSCYTLAGLLGWSDLVRYWWVVIEGAFCLFAEQGGGFFMPLPPLGGEINPRILKECWSILHVLNGGEPVSRIEGVEPYALGQPAWKDLRLRRSEPEYLYWRRNLVGLQGDSYRSQRWAVNRCRRERKISLRPFEAEDLIPCLQLYTHWAIRRQRSPLEPLDKAFIQDGLFFHRRLMVSAQDFRMQGRVLEVDGQIGGYTFGAPVSPKVFCIFLEIADRTIPGVSQVLFQEFCRELTAYSLVNAMGDYGFSGLKRAKLSYRPIGFVWTASLQLPFLINNTTNSERNSWTGGELNP